MTVIAKLTAEWWASLAKLKADILGANGNDAILEAACNAERERAEGMLRSIEEVGGMTPAEAARLLYLALVLFADDRREDDIHYRLLSVIRDGLAPPVR